MSDYIRINQEIYDKAIGQFRLQLGAIMNCFRCYGLQEDVDGAMVEIVKLAEQFAMRVRGKDISIMVRSKPRRRPTE
uniref:Uncharacterized protein n=1 Tax=viral metagenome TaxID=1070528 RepID=A0A6M3LC78_9ZZZZ